VNEVYKNNEILLKGSDGSANKDIEKVIENKEIKQSETLKRTSTFKIVRKAY
jgi:hypothetical protein